MILSRIFMIFMVVGILALGVLFFASSKSYQYSLQARIEYFLENYEQSLELSQKAYGQDNYNKMAFTLLMQSKIALKYKRYIKQGDEYLDKINQISLKREITNADRIKIKMMCEVMLEEYKNLIPTKLTHESLLQKSKTARKQFEEIHKKLF